jgi:rare lipoprotein A
MRSLATVLVLAACAGSASASPPRTSVRQVEGGEVLTGRASYYNDRFTGRRTANGERYDPAALTAASRDLPFGTRVRVTRVDTGASVIVRINDRGPFRDHRRILDLSRAAAQELDMIRAGVIEIRVEVLSD